MSDTIRWHSRSSPTKVLVKYFLTLAQGGYQAQQQRLKCILESLDNYENLLHLINVGIYELLKNYETLENLVRLRTENQQAIISNKIKSSVQKYYP